MLLLLLLFPQVQGDGKELWLAELILDTEEGPMQADKFILDKRKFQILSLPVVSRRVMCPSDISL